MNVVSKIVADLTRPNIGARVNAVQGDGNTRLVEITLLCGGVTWTPPDGVEAAIAYYQPSGTKGLYNKLADGTAAISISGNVATVILAPQMLTASGTVQASLVFNDAQLNRLTTFPFAVSVASNPSVGAQKTEDYIRLQWLEDKLDEYLRKASDSGAFDGKPGDNGVTFTPSVSENGDLSWRNNGGLPNPQTVNIRGKQGDSTAATAAANAAQTSAANAETHAADAAASAAAAQATVGAMGTELSYIKADLEKQRAVSNDIAESNVVWNAEKVTVSGSSAWTGSYIDTDISVKEGTTYYLHIDSVENCKSNVCAAFRLYKDGKSYFLTELTVSDVQNGNSVSITIGDYSDTYNIKVILYRNCSESVTEFGTTTFNGARVTTGSPDIKYQAKAKCKSYWDGKKIVWFGTSIPAGVYDYDETRNYYNKDTSYPRIVGSILGAFVFNEAVGSSAMHTRSASLITESNPYGYPADFEYSAKTFSDSLEMKEWLIAHYDDAYWQRQRWSTMTNAQKNSIRSWSWENKLNRYLTGGSVGPVDLYVFDHGYNDPKDSESGHDYAANKAAYGEDNLYSFHGACNYLLRKIYSDNPNAKVVWISHYTRNYSETLKELYAMQKEVCEDWDIYLIPLCDKLGWSNKEVTVKGQWVKQPEGGYLWVEDGTERTITVKDANVPDGTHPALDKSGNSNIVIAEALASMINGLFKD